MQALLLPVVWGLICIALARPQWVGEPLTKTVASRDLMLVVDLSTSMEAEDFTSADGRTINRLEAKTVLDDFLLRRKGDRIGLIVFGSAAYVQTPFTEDMEACRTLLAETEVGSFSNCVAFDFMLPGAVDADHFYTFCPESGLVAYIDGMGTSHALFEATINGAKVTSRTREEQPNETTLWAGNYPNPFQETTTFSFRIPQAGHASLQLYTLQGRLATTVASGVFQAGMHQIRWDASDFVSGIYFFVIQTDGQRFARPVHLIR